jgi:hypothetical protein
MRALIDRVARDSTKGDVEIAARDVARARNVIEAILSLVEDRIEVFDFGCADYDSPSWAAKQAHQNGKKQMLRELTALLRDKS